jgi:succinate dehydrogenase/fumarate reductase iron-sulfur protein
MKKESDIIEGKRVRARIFRFDPKRDEKPEYRSYKVPIVEGNTVLDVLLYVYENYDPGIAFRHSCQHAKCGVCSVTVNGKVVLACIHRAENDMVIEPLKGFEVIRDLVIDFDKRKRG